MGRRSLEEVVCAKLSGGDVAGDVIGGWNYLGGDVIDNIV